MPPLPFSLCLGDRIPLFASTAAVPPNGTKVRLKPAAIIANPGGALRPGGRAARSGLGLFRGGGSTPRGNKGL